MNNCRQKYSHLIITRGFQKLSPEGQLTAHNSQVVLSYFPCQGSYTHFTWHRESRNCLKTDYLRTLKEETNKGVSTFSHGFFWESLRKWTNWELDKEGEKRQFSSKNRKRLQLLPFSVSEEFIEGKLQYDGGGIRFTPKHNTRRRWTSSREVARTSFRIFKRNKIIKWIRLI